MTYPILKRAPNGVILLPESLNHLRDEIDRSAGVWRLTVEFVQDAAGVQHDGDTIHVYSQIYKIIGVDADPPTEYITILLNS